MGTPVRKEVDKRGRHHGCPPGLLTLSMAEGRADMVALELGSYQCLFLDFESRVVLSRSPGFVIEGDWVWEPC